MRFVAAGHEGNEGGFGTVSSPGTAADAITVAAVTNDRIFALPLTSRAAARRRFRSSQTRCRSRPRGTRGLTLELSTGWGAGASNGTLVLVKLTRSCTASRRWPPTSVAGNAGLVVVHAPGQLNPGPDGRPPSPATEATPGGS